MPYDKPKSSRKPLITNRNQRKMLEAIGDAPVGYTAPKRSRKPKKAPSTRKPTTSSR